MTAPGTKRKVKKISRGKIKVVGKAIDRFAASTIYGFVYDTRKIKKEWLNG